jgi:hypothetical protein
MLRCWPSYVRENQRQQGPKPTVLATALAKEDERTAETRTLDDENALLVALSDNPRATFAGLAVALGWVSLDSRRRSSIARRTSVGAG